ncbi:MAG: hypothetical protein H7256_04155 [Bdellovibrio sp.]|nr:hypothetical protein [Bdellovibrio sp.]
MRHHKLFFQHPKLIRDQLNAATDLADHIHQQEKLLIQKLSEIDRNRFYVRYGFKSLSGFCTDGLKFSKTQTQRIVTQVRRYEPTSNIRPQANPKLAENCEN